MRLGIMQGRLVPPVEGRIQCFPRDTWGDEFALAAQAGLSAIEWIYDVYGADANPLASDAGLQRIRTLSLQHGIEVHSVCADYFIDKPLVRGGEAELAERNATLTWLLRRCKLLSIRRIVLPFVDASSIDTQNDLKRVVAVLSAVLPLAEEAKVELHLETSLAPDEFAALLSELPHPLVRVNYDSGNSASLGFHPRDEFQAYGPRVGSVHIKDRVRGGSTVPLGSGDVDFEALGQALQEHDFHGDFILQAARGRPGDEVAWARQNRLFVEAAQLGQR